MQPYFATRYSRAIINQLATIMLTKNQIKFITSLHHSKFRKEQGVFIAEGVKIANELLKSDYEIETIHATENGIKKLNFGKNRSAPFVNEILEKELKQISALINPGDVLCVVKLPPHYSSPDTIPISGDSFKALFKNKLILALDGIQDPGNLGTLIRIADWFDIETIFCSENCADAYSPKVIQATMGSFVRVSVYKCSLIKLFTQLLSGIKNYPVYATVLKGSTIYTSELSQQGIILLGNEAHGVSEELIRFAKHRICIPSFGGAESLNVASAAAVICSEFRSRV